MTDRAFGPGPFDSAAEREPQARVDQVDRAVVARPDGRHRRVPVEAHLEVRQQHAAGAGPGRKVATAGPSRCCASGGTGPAPKLTSLRSASPGRISGSRSAARPQSPE